MTQTEKLKTILKKYEKNIHINDWMSLRDIVEHFENVEDDLIKCSQSFESSQEIIENKQMQIDASKKYYSTMTISHKLRFLFKNNEQN